MFATSYTNQEQLIAAVENAKQKLGPEVVRLVYSIGENSNGDPASYFRIVLTDEASRDHSLGRSANKIKDFFFDEIRPYQDWDMGAYLNNLRNRCLLESLGITCYAFQNVRTHGDGESLRQNLKQAAISDRQRCFCS